MKKKVKGLEKDLVEKAPTNLDDFVRIPFS